MENIRRSRLRELHIAVLSAVALSAAGCAARAPCPEPEAPEPVACSCPPQAQTTWSVYRVEAGDTSAALARCSGVSLAELVERNHLGNPDRLATGSELQLPPGHRCRTATPLKPVAAAPSAPRRAPDAILREGRRLLEAAQKRQDAADFAGALAAAEACSRTLAPAVLDREADATRARCHAVAALAAAGLGRKERAVEEFRRAFAVDPGVELGSSADSPRIRALVDAAKLDARDTP